MSLFDIIFGSEPSPSTHKKKSFFDLILKSTTIPTPPPTDPITRLKNITGIKDPFTAAADAVCDTVFDETIEQPKVGSVVLCGLFFGMAKHSGIYIGYNQIVHLNGDGYIEKVSAKEFLNRLDGLNFSVDIYVSCLNGKPVGSKAVADRAKKMVGKKLDYKLFENNCHKFSSSCLTGIEKTECFRTSQFPDLKIQTEKILESNEWLVWQRSS
ncbi:hypothetical protein P256_00214 [Acinetobacter nectaris CIP 110549]|uniref:LRAT domain-containing protein n=1 Tax=Acinetobacter nectaris CIP 110549 TaxID=1392540 RepID=V2TZ89_9GAMM|nr:lecithin retinol acyltransferase family protein [Acinetobacter nectaris]ESK41225.1 hypothetical protein P256_00214 [Acinetobacter nectaris CIP 110549]